MAVKDEGQEQPTKPKRSHSCETCPSVPNEIIVEILLKLSVGSLIRCKSVCKLWHSLISDPYFIKSHLTLSTCKPHYIHHRLISSYDFSSCRLYDVMFDKPITVVEIHPFKDPRGVGWIRGSCNGLLLICHNSNMFMWNPVTGRSSKVPEDCLKTMSRMYMLYGFGYDETTDDYKVVVISDSNLVKIYSLKFGDWKNCDNFPKGINPMQIYGTYLNGTLYWVGRKYSLSWRIVSFDLEKETYGEVSPPVPEYDEGGNGGLTLGVLGEWLCVLCNYPTDRADVWIMKVYGVKDSWTKLVSVPYLIDPGRHQYSVPLCISNDGRVLLLKLGNKLVKYDSKINSFLEIENFVKNNTSVYTFLESLVSPKVRMA